MRLRKGKQTWKRVLSLSLVCTLVLGLFVCADILYPTKDNAAHAAPLTANGQATVVTPQFYKSKQMPAFNNNGGVVYMLADNGWYGVTNGSTYWELVDTDASIKGVGLSSRWGWGGGNGQTLLNYTNGLADAYLASLKEAMQTANVDCSPSTGAISGAYMWPLTYAQLNYNRVLGGKLKSNTSSRIWTRTGVRSDSGNADTGSAWYIVSNSGELDRGGYDENYRVVPAFNFMLSNVLMARNTPAPQAFGELEEPGGYLVADTAGGYAEGFASDVIAGKALIGFNWDAVYSIPYTGAAEGGHVVAALYQSDGSVAYYGSIDTADSSEGIGYLNLSGVSVGEYTLALWEENGTSGLASSPVYANLKVVDKFEDEIMDQAEHIARTEAGDEYPSENLHKFFEGGRTVEYLTVDSTQNSLQAETDILTEEPVALGNTYSIPVYDLNTDEGGKGHIKYISAIICDEEDTPLYYGKLDYVAENADTAVKLTIPTTLDKAVTYTLYLFEETASTANDDTASVPVKIKFHVTYKSISSGGDRWLSDTQNGIVWYYELDDDLNAVNVWTKDAPDKIIDADGCLNVPATMGKLKYPVVSIGGGSADTTFVPASYNGYNSISFPSNTTKINRFAFQGCQATINLVIPSQIKVIESKAFYKASYLRSVTIKGADLEIQKQAFAKCARLKSFVDTGNHVTIGEMAFYKNPALSNVSLFEEVTIGAYAFAENSALTSLKMDLMSGSIESKAFENCDALGKVYIPSTITVEAYAFNSCDSLTSIEINMVQLGENVFANCPEIIKVILDGNVETVAYNWGGYKEVPSEGSITETGNAVSSNEKSSDREFYVFGRNTIFQFARDTNGNYYSAFGYARDNSTSCANHNYYRVTTVYYTTAEKLTPEEAIGEQVRTAENAACIENEDGSAMLTACCEDIEDIANKGIGEVNATDAGYMLSAHQAGKIGTPKDAADAKSIRESFLEQDYSMPTAQVGIAASYPVAVSAGETINKASFLVYPVYNDGTPYKAPYEADQFYIMDTDSFEALKTNEATASYFKGGLLTADEETFRQIVGDDSSIMPRALDEDSVNGAQSVTVVAYGAGRDGKMTAYTTTVAVTITKKANDYDSLVNEYGSIGAVYVVIANLKDDIAAYKAEVIASTNQMWKSLGIADRDSTASMTTAQLLENFKAASAATMEAAGSGDGDADAIQALEQELKEKEAELARMTESYVAVVEQLNALLQASGGGDSSGEAKAEDFIRVHPTEDGSPGKTEVWIDGKWYEVVSGDPANENGATIKMEITLEDGTKTTVDAVVKVTDEKINVSYTDPSTGGAVEENYDTKLQQLIKSAMAKLLQVRQELSAMNAGLEGLEELLGLTASEDEASDLRFQEVYEKVSAMKKAYESLLADYDRIVRKIYNADENVDLSGKTVDQILMQINSLSGDTTAIAKQLQTAITGANVSDDDLKTLSELLLEVEQIVSDLTAKSDLLQQIMDTLGVTDSAQILQQILSLQTQVSELTKENATLKKQIENSSAGGSSSGGGTGAGNAANSNQQTTIALANQISTLTKENAALEKENQNLSDKIRSLESKNSALDHENADLKRINDSLVKKNEKLSSTNKMLEDANKALGKKADTLTGKNAALKNTVDSLKKSAAKNAGSTTTGVAEKSTISAETAANNKVTSSMTGSVPGKQASPTTGELAEKRTNGTTNDTKENREDKGAGMNADKVSGGTIATADHGTSGSTGDAAGGSQKEKGETNVNIDQVRSVVKPESDDRGFGKVVSIELPEKEKLESGSNGNVIGLSMDVLYADTVETNGSGATETTNEQKENANTIFTYYANNPDELAKLGWQEAGSVAADKSKMITMNAMTSIDILPSAIQEAAFEKGIASMVDLASDDFANGKVYLMVHESEERSGLFDIALVEAENGSLDVALEDLSPISVAEVHISDTASFDGVLQDAPSGEELTDSGKSNGVLKVIFIVLAIVVIGIAGMLLLMKKQGTLNFGFAKNK